jgi:hypothetical protein
MLRQPPKPIAKLRKRLPRLRNEGLRRRCTRIRHRQRIPRLQEQSPRFTLQQRLRRRTQLLRPLLLRRPQLLLL